MHSHIIQDYAVNNTELTDEISFSHNLGYGFYKIQTFKLRTNYQALMYAKIKTNTTFTSDKNTQIYTDTVEIDITTPRSKRCFECNQGSMFDVTQGACPVQEQVTCYQGHDFACMRFERIENSMHKIIQSCKKADACEIQKKNFQQQSDCSNGKNCIIVTCCYDDYCNDLNKSKYYNSTMAKVRIEREKREKYAEQTAQRARMFNRWKNNPWHRG